MGGGGGGILGGVGEALFGDGGAEAAGNAAIATQIESRRQYDQTKQRIGQSEALSRQAGDQFNAATVQGLMSLERDIKNQEKNLTRQEQLVSQIDPTIIEASQQALRLLRGEQSSTLNPLKDQRASQRQKVVNMLREQLGPGAETSTAGIQALTRFDSETDQIFAGAQQQALGNLGGVAGQFNQVRPDMFREIMGLSSLGQQQYGLGAAQAGFTRGQADFMNQGTQMLQGAGQNMINSAGAGYVQANIRGQNAASFGQAITGAAIGALNPIGAAAGGLKSLFSKANPMSGATAMAGQSYKDVGNLS